ncbi:thioredoxin family protein [Streptomyces sp. NPDC058682]|uniref:thioredoxin family protein n=1 Tax=Streptomyces sp. NPDC058682 TaxID=3346596 RepID=UPI003650FED3
MSVIEATSSEQFKELLSKNANVAVSFDATWCGPCKKIGPVFTKLSDHFSSVVFVSVDVDGLSEEQGVSALPFFKFYSGGEEAVEALVGASESQLQEKLAALNAM